MSTRVLSTQTAKDSITAMKSIIEGQLEETLSNLKNQGQTLSDPNVWDGAKANEFREIWSEARVKIDAMSAAMRDLHQRIDAINADIFQAGGNL